jgi:hypothetical protein
MLPYEVQAIFDYMLANGSLSERQQAFFTDTQLVKFWRKVSGYLPEVPEARRDDAASILVGSFIIPISFGYGDTGTVDQPTRKTRIREAQKKADLIIDRIADLAGELGDALEELESITSVHPCEVRFLHVVQSLFHDEAVQNLSGYWLGVRTYEALRILEHKFRDYPLAHDQFKGIPGLASQKATWRDWMREAERGLEDMMRFCPSKLSLSESDWVNLAQVLIGKHITRGAVQDAWRSCNPQPE